MNNSYTLDKYLYALSEYFIAMCDAEIRLPAFQPGKCRCRTGGLNKKAGISNFVGTQCHFTAGENGICSQHKLDHKFGFYDEPRPTRWGFTYDGRHIPLPASEEKKRGKPIPWKKNVILPEQPEQPEQSEQRETSHPTTQQESETSKYFSELKILKQEVTKVISEHQERIDLLEKQLESANRKAREAESKSVNLQLTVDKQNDMIKGLRTNLKEICSKFTGDKDEDEDEIQEDKSSYVEIEFEEVSYIEDEDTGDIYNFKYQKIGKWNDDSDDIIWSSPEFKTAHENNPSHHY